MLGLEQRARAGARGLRGIMAEKQTSEAARSEIMRKACLAWRGVGSGANPANPRGVAIRAELEWRGVGALREFGIARIDGEFQNYNSANSNSKLIPVALEWRCGIGL